ncbi:PAS domain S-box protein [Flavobacterium sp. J49]|uniref:PAS domain S-box protein n=1 Tax=Flavobacterium sp. J49 TaxID=2718534 RepID=UPI00159427AD|nr:PAS domain S-box protein [Flavobacterium sp. J49]MBF6641949.1 PAS domain S-box protein [Flavobacterium sp. J49]NIC03196.1 PAS domain S-box protein [Flavobacterium sp. J49]
MSQTQTSEDQKNKSQDLFFDMFENSAIGMIFIDTKTAQFKYVNKSFLKCFGFTKEEIIGKTATELGIVNPEFQEKLALEFKNNETINTIEIILKNKKGVPFWFLVSIQAMKYMGNDCSLISFIDITQQKKTTAQLVIANKELAFQNKEKEKRAAELVIANIELEHQNSEKEKRADELLVANKELEYQNKIKEKRADELVIANKELEFQTGEKQNRANELVIADKELNFQNEEKEKRVSENKELEAYNYSLKAASQYSLSLIEASRDPLFTISPKGKITDTNQASVRVTGVSKEKLIGSDFFNYFTEPQQAKKIYEEVFEKGFVIDYPLVITDGELVPVLFNGSVYKDQNGNVIGAVVVARDITEQKRAEQELIEAKTFAELASSIAEKTKIMAEKATKEANEAVKSKQQFLSNMSHEIRTPMNAIIGFTKVVLKTELTAKQKEYLMAIKMSGDALIVLINDILDLAKVDAGKMTFEKTPFKLKLSIKAMLHLFETKIQEKNLKLITHYDASIPDVLVGDPVRLHQIILNLVSNAVKFTNVGQITVSVKLVSETDDDVALQFSVTDTGIGINDTKTETIFENFQQATSGTSRIFGGTGLGLAIVKQLVEAQNGTINVESTLGEGSTFSFILYFDKTDAEAVLDPEITEIDTDIKDTKILVVEDMELNQLLMKTVLDDFGFECEIAGNGKIAIDKLEKNTYDIILMDLQMPEMNGFEATEYIRKTLKLSLPIIALTADVTTVDVAKCKAVGMNDYISKPVDERLLYSKLISFIKKPVAIIENKSIGNKHTQTIKYVDLSYLTKLTKANPILMGEMINAYIKQTPPLVDLMKQSFKDKDWSLLKATAHKMMPSFAIMGIHPEFTELAQKVQEYAEKLERSIELNDLVEQLEKVCNESLIELKQELLHLKL